MCVQQGPFQRSQQSGSGSRAAQKGLAVGSRSSGVSSGSRVSGLKSLRVSFAGLGSQEGSQVRSARVKVQGAKGRIRTSAALNTLGPVPMALTCLRACLCVRACD
ncbi:hypothetical protein EYF80_066312 [Liparis tanakae]|uniref:Uncharacterized protein n=1 Tax=Liparis tanakae TaxID=230148 RepID=A0A4Z2E3Q1_9TELE|nr:hypothetical protein EYF80_066312 [Liparis tanakae]